MSTDLGCRRVVCVAARRTQLIAFPFWAFRSSNRLHCPHFGQSDAVPRLSSRVTNTVSCAAAARGPDDGDCRTRPRAAECQILTRQRTDAGRYIPTERRTAACCSSLECQCLCIHPRRSRPFVFRISRVARTSRHSTAWPCTCPRCRCKGPPAAPALIIWLRQLQVLARGYCGFAGCLGCRSRK